MTVWQFVPPCVFYFFIYGKISHAHMFWYIIRVLACRCLVPVDSIFISSVIWRQCGILILSTDWMTLSVRRNCWKEWLLREEPYLKTSPVMVMCCVLRVGVPACKAYTSVVMALLYSLYSVPWYSWTFQLGIYATGRRRSWRQILKRGRPADNWFIIGTSSHTAGRKFVKNLKYKNGVCRPRSLWSKNFGSW